MRVKLKLWQVSWCWDYHQKKQEKKRTRWKKVTKFIYKYSDIQYTQSVRKQRLEARARSCLYERLNCTCVRFNHSVLSRLLVSVIFCWYAVVFTLIDMEIRCKSLFTPSPFYLKVLKKNLH